MSSILMSPALGGETGIKLVTTGGRCYRVPVERSVGGKKLCLSPSADNRFSYDQNSKEYILKAAEGRSHTYKFIVEQNSSEIRQIEETTGARVDLPSAKKGIEEEGAIFRGPSECSVLEAKALVDLLYSRKLKELPFTHFISIPLTIPSLLPKLENLLNDIRLNYCHRKDGLDPSLVQKAERVHLTLLMLRLPSDAQIRTAISILDKINEDLMELFSPTDQVHVRGITTINPKNPKNTRVAYLNIAPDTPARDKILTLRERIVSKFVLAGLSSSFEAEKFILHATIMNTSFCENPSPFDISRILESKEDVDLGVHKLEKLQLSIRGGEKDSSGYYRSAGTLHFP